MNIIQSYAEKQEMVHTALKKPKNSKKNVPPTEKHFV